MSPDDVLLSPGRRQSGRGTQRDSPHQLILNATPPPLSASSLTPSSSTSTSSILSSLPYHHSSVASSSNLEGSSSVLNLTQAPKSVQTESIRGDDENDEAENPSSCDNGQSTLAVGRPRSSSHADIRPVTPGGGGLDVGNNAKSSTVTGSTYSRYSKESIEPEISPGEAALEFFAFLRGSSLFHFPSNHPMTPPPRLESLRLKARQLLMEVDSVLGKSSASQAPGITHCFPDNPWVKVNDMKSLHVETATDNEAAYDVILSYPIVSQIVANRAIYFKVLDEYERQASKIFTSRTGTGGGATDMGSRVLSSRLGGELRRAYSPYTTSIPAFKEILFVAFKAETNVEAKRRRITALSSVDQSALRKIGVLEGGSPILEDSTTMNAPHGPSKDAEKANLRADSIVSTPPGAAAPPAEAPSLKCHRMEVVIVPAFGSLMLIMTSSFRNLKIQQLLNIPAITHIRLGSPEFESIDGLLELAQKGGTLLPRLQVKPRVNRRRQRGVRRENIRSIFSKVCRGFRYKNKLCTLDCRTVDSGEIDIATCGDPAMDETRVGEYYHQQRYNSMPSRVLKTVMTPSTSRFAGTDHLYDNPFGPSNEAEGGETMSPMYGASPDRKGFGGGFRRSRFTLLRDNRRASWRTRLRTRRLTSMFDTDMDTDYVQHINGAILSWLQHLHESLLNVDVESEVATRECRLISIYFQSKEMPLVMITDDLPQTGRILQCISLTHYFLERTFVPLCLGSNLARSFKGFIRAQPSHSEHDKLFTIQE